ncbi:MAG: oligosaccharide flippase family protein [Promethearchaeota archaeon]
MEKFNHKNNKNKLYLKIRESSIYMAIGKIIINTIGFLITIYIIRKLSVNEFGIYNILLAVMGYIGLFSSFGLPDIFKRYIPEFNERRQISNLKKLVNKGLLLRTLLSILFVLLMILFSNQAGKILKISNWLGYFKIFSLGIIFSLESNLLSVALTSLFLHKYFTISNLLYIILRGCILYFFLNIGLGLNGLLLGEVICYGILMIMFIYLYKFKFVQFNKGNNNNNEVFPLKRIARYGGFSYFNQVGTQILSVSTDFFIISAFLGPSDVGIYAFANRIMQKLSRAMPHNLIREVISPTFFSRYSQTKNSNELEKMFNILTKFAAFFLFPLAVGILILGDKLIIYIFGTKYISSLKVLWIVAIFTALNSFVFSPTELVLQSIERVQIIFFSKIFAIYNLIGDLLVVKSYGIIGIAFVTATAILFKNLFLLAFAYKYTNINIDFKNIGKILFNSSLMGIIFFLIKKRVTNILILIFVVLIGLFTYFIIAYFNKSFTEDERKIVNRILPKPIFVF